jgi:hypothetical protein
MTIPLIAIEVVIGFAVPVAWAVWQLVSVRRELRRDREKAAREAAEQQPAPGADPPSC